MKNIFIFTYILMACSACVVSAMPVDSDKTSTSEAKENVSVLEVEYACERGSSIRVQYNNTDTAVLFRGDTAIELKQMPSGSGFIYSNGPNTIRGKGDELRLEIGRMRAIPCKAIKKEGE